MKRKKFKKLLIDTLAEFYQEKNNRKSKYPETAMEEEPNHQFYTETTDDTKKKVRNLIIRMLALRDSINFSSNDRVINLSSEISISSTALNPKSGYDYFSIEIIKDLGFTLSYNNKRIVLKDENLFDEIKPEIKIAFDKINNNNFSDLYGIVMKEKGLSRESNLDELLEEWGKS